MESVFLVVEVIEVGCHHCCATRKFNLTQRKCVSFDHTLTTTCCRKRGGEEPGR